MNNNENINVTNVTSSLVLPEQNENTKVKVKATPKPKGTGYLRANSPKPKKVKEIPMSNTDTYAQTDSTDNIEKEKTYKQSKKRRLINPQEGNSNENNSIDNSPTSNNKVNETVMDSLNTNLAQLHQGITKTTVTSNNQDPSIRSKKLKVPLNPNPHFNPTNHIENSDNPVTPVSISEQHPERRFEKPNPNKRKTPSLLQNKSSTNSVHHISQPQLSSQDSKDLIISSKNPDSSSIEHSFITSKSQVAKNGLKKPQPFSKQKKQPHFQKNKEYKTFDKRHVPNMPDEDQVDYTPRIYSSLENILSFMRQRTGFVLADFWKQFNLIQSGDNPIHLEKEIKSLILNSILFNKEEIYATLLEKYGHFLKPEDFADLLFTYCSNKDSFFLDKSIDFYSKNMSDKANLTDILIKKLAHCSFRQENNFVWISWIDRQATQEQIKQFWDRIFEFNNVVAVIEALFFKNTSLFLKNNIANYQEKIELSSHQYQIKHLLDQPEYHVDRANQHFKSNSEYNEKQFENALLEQIKIKKDDKERKGSTGEKKEDVTPEIVIRKKKPMDIN